MAEQKFCQDCNQKHDCREVYRQLSDTKSPPVVFKAVVAFLLPILVFIVSLAASEKILAGIINSKEAQTVLSFLLALAVTSVCMLIIRAINRTRTNTDSANTD